MSMTQQSAPDWRRLTEAAPLVGVSSTKLSRMAKRGEINTRKDPRDERVLLVDLNELKRRFEIS